MSENLHNVYRTPASSRIVVAGRGRIGGPLAGRLRTGGLAVRHARIDPDRGLDGVAGPIDTLVIAVSPRARSAAGVRWRWRDLFTGLRRQVDAGDIEIRRAIFVSSTGVWSGYARGFVDAATPVSPGTAQQRELVDAERMLAGCATRIRIVRPAGLTGAGYRIYRPILRAGQGRPRFGVDVADVIDRIVTLVRRPLWSSGVELLTDGCVWWQGARLVADRTDPRVRALASYDRILLSSVHGRG